jgi:ribosome-binding factor A
LRVGEELRHALARILGRAAFDDPALAATSFTVTEVRMSADLQEATAFVVPLGGGGLDDSVAALNRAAGFIRGQVAREVVLRHCPRLAFAADRSFDNARRVQAVFERPHVRRDLDAGAADDDETGGGDAA